MTDDETTRPRSRPWLIVIDLRRLSVANSSGPVPIQTTVDTLWAAAIETGLPLIVIAGADDIMPSDMEDAYPPRVTFVDDDEAAFERLSAFRRIPADLANLSHTARDVLWISKNDGPIADLKTMRPCAIHDAIPTLRILSNQYRAEVLHGTLPVEAETTHTVLLPLDLDLSSMDDPHLIYSHGRFVFDAVLLVEGQVATAGFKLKTLEKLIAGYAPLLYGFDNELFDGADELRTTLRRLHACGARDVIGVCGGQKDHEAHHPFVDNVQKAGLTWRQTTWNDLVSRDELHRRGEPLGAEALLICTKSQGFSESRRTSSRRI